MKKKTKARLNPDMLVEYEFRKGVRSTAETMLLRKINRGVPVDLHHRYDELIGKREARELTQKEHKELLTNPASGLK